MTRRLFLQSGGALAAGSWPVLGLGAVSGKVGTSGRPSRAQVEWQDCEIGVIFHLDMPVVAGDLAPNNAVQKVFDPRLYDPSRLDTDQWAAAARGAGARYAIFTATHFNGFLQWQSDLYPYGLKQAAWRDGKGDIVGDFVASCRAAGLRPGLYLSTHRNVYQTVWGHYVDWGKGKGTAKQRAFNRIAEKMTEELCSRYGELLEIWFDAGVKTPDEGGPDVLPIFEKYQPNSLFYSSSARADIRWIGNEKGYAGYPCWATMPDHGVGVSHNRWPVELLEHGDPDGTYWSPGMVDVPLRGARGVHNWFWRPGQDHGAYTGDELIDLYYTSVGRNCNLVIGAVVKPDGTIPESDIRRLEDFGRRVRRLFGRPVGEIRGEGNELDLNLGGVKKVDHVVIMEDIVRGERIRRYRVDGMTTDGEWRELCTGASVGHKRIQRVEPAVVSRVRLSVSCATAMPIIRRLAVYSGA